MSGCLVCFPVASRASGVACAPHGAFTGFFFSVLTMGINFLYQRRSLVLWLIDGIYVLLGLAIAGMIPGGWK